MDGKECHEHSRFYAPCYLPIEGTIHPELAVMPEGHPCVVFGDKKMSTWNALV